MIGTLIVWIYCRLWLINLRGPDINDSGLIPQRAPVNAGRRTTSDLLELLDSRASSGVTTDEFKRLVVRCTNCRSFTTRRAFRNHTCQQEVIDLTGDA
jgi:hypothetical protein